MGHDNQCLGHLLAFFYKILENTRDKLKRIL